jgi:hypothetical protein
MPLDTDTYAVGRDLQLERVIRTASSRKTLLEQRLPRRWRWSRDRTEQEADRPRKLGRLRRLTPAFPLRSSREWL